MIGDHEVRGLWKSDAGDCLLRVIGIHRTNGAFNTLELPEIQNTAIRVRLDVDKLKGDIKLDETYRCILPKRSGTSMQIDMTKITMQGGHWLLTVNLRVPSMPEKKYGRITLPSGTVAKMGKVTLGDIEWP